MWVCTRCAVLIVATKHTSTIPNKSNKHKIFAGQECLFDFAILRSGSQAITNGTQHNCRGLPTSISFVYYWYDICVLTESKLFLTYFHSFGRRNCTSNKYCGEWDVRQTYCREVYNWMWETRHTVGPLISAASIVERNTKRLEITLVFS